jgi:hypothetical protein
MLLAIQISLHQIQDTIFKESAIELLNQENTKIANMRRQNQYLGKFISKNRYVCFVELASMLLMNHKFTLATL